MTAASASLKVNEKEVLKETKKVSNDLKTQNIRKDLG